MVKKGDQHGAIAPAALTFLTEWPPRKGAWSMSQQLPDCPPGGIETNGFSLKLSRPRRRRDCPTRPLTLPSRPAIRPSETLECTTPGPQVVALCETLASWGSYGTARNGPRAFLHCIDALGPQIPVWFDGGCRREVVRKSVAEIRRRSLESPDIPVRARSALVGRGDWLNLKMWIICLF